MKREKIAERERLIVKERRSGDCGRKRQTTREKDINKLKIESQRERKR